MLGIEFLGKKDMEFFANLMGKIIKDRKESSTVSDYIYTQYQKFNI